MKTAEDKVTGSKIAVNLGELIEVTKEQSLASRYYTLRKSLCILLGLPCGWPINIDGFLFEVLDEGPIRPDNFYIEEASIHILPYCEENISDGYLEHLITVDESQIMDKMVEAVDYNNERIAYIAANIALEYVRARYTPVYNWIELINLGAAAAIKKKEALNSIISDDFMYLNAFMNKHGIDPEDIEEDKLDLLKLEIIKGEESLHIDYHNEFRTSLNVFSIKAMDVVFWKESLIN